MDLAQMLRLALILANCAAVDTASAQCDAPAEAIRPELWRDGADPDFARLAGAPPIRLDGNRRLGTSRILLGGD